MKVKTFISQSSHKDFFDLIDVFLSTHHPNETGREAVLSELVKQKELLESIFVQYKGKFDELHRLIAEYQVRQTDIRKKIRQIQLKKKEKQKENPSLTKTIKSSGSLPAFLYLLLNSLLYDNGWVLAFDNFN